MISQQFKISDIQQSLVNGEGFAAVQLTPVDAPTDMLLGGAVKFPQQCRITGISAADVQSFKLDDILTLTLTKSL